MIESSRYSKRLPERSILIEFIFFFYFIYIKMRGDICEDTTPLTKKFLNYDSQKESVNINRLQRYLVLLNY